MYTIYRVMPNDTINSISSRLGIDKSILLMINGFDENKILLPGEEIIVPMNNNGFNTYIVDKGDSIYAIAKKYNTDYKTLLLLNGLEEDDYIYPNQQIIIPSSNRNIYVVKENDTLKSIASNLGTSEEELLSKNNNIYLQENQIIIY